MPNYRIHNFFLVLCSLLFLLASCYERQEGCLDINAANYDFAADDPCDDCCTYPSMKLSVTHAWGDTFLMNDSLYFNDLGQYIRIISSKFYLSEISLSTSSEDYFIEEELSVSDNLGNTSSIRDDIIFVQSSRVNYTVGTFSLAGVYDKLSFRLGVGGNYEATDSTESFVQDLSFFDEELYEHTNLRLEYVIDTVAMDTLQMDLSGLEFTEIIDLNQDFEIPRGTNFTVPIIANYQSLLTTLDFTKLGELQEKAKLLSNLDHFFSF